MNMLLEVDRVTSGYGDTPILHDISIRVEQDEIVTVIGPNGSGKSTLLKTIFGLIRPAGGTIRFGSIDLTNMGSHRIAKTGVGYVPQLENVFPSLTVIDNLQMGAYNRKGAGGNELVKEVSDIFPVIEVKRNEKAGNLSGGERQMLAIARALVGKPQILLLDEPTASLAPNLVGEILDKLHDIRTMGTSILLVEQNAQKSLQISDRAYVLVMGKKVLEGTANEVLGNEEIGQLYLGKRGKTKRGKTKKG
tara:strand:- start:1809 stop:2555 length:747 start_codon:yes stop_codon:yes gene_type:complete